MQRAAGSIGSGPSRPSAVAACAVRTGLASFGPIFAAILTYMLPTILLVAVLSGSLAVASTPSSGSVLVIVLADAIVMLFGSLLGQAAGVHAALSAMCGVPPTRASSVRAAWDRLGNLVVLTIVADLVAALGGLLVGVMAAVFVLAGLLAVIPFVYVLFGWVLTLPVAVVEGRGASALRRSRQLVSGRWWATFGTCLLVGVPISAAAAVLQSALRGHAPYAVVELLGAGVEVLVAPITAALFAALYLDLRFRSDRVGPERTAVDLGLVSPAPPVGHPGLAASGWQPGASRPGPPDRQPGPPDRQPGPPDRQPGPPGTGRAATWPSLSPKPTPQQRPLRWADEPETNADPPDVSPEPTPDG